MSETIEAAAEAGTADEDLMAQAVTNDGSTTQEEPTDQEQPEPEEIEEIELSFGARKVAVPKGTVPEHVLAALKETSDGMHKDYTEKTQSIAEQRDQLKGERELVQKLTTLKGDALKAFASGQALADEIQQLEQINTRDLWQSNPDQARQISDALSYKRAQFNAQVNAVAQHEQAMAAEEQRATAKLAEAGRTEVARAIKGFDETAEKELIAYAVKAGFPEQAARNWPLDPRTAIMAHKAMMYDRLQTGTKAATAAKAPAPTAAPVRPVVGGGAGSGPKSPDQMSDDEYFRHEMAKAAKAARR